MRGALLLALSALVAIVVVAVNAGAIDERRIIRETEASLDETGRYVDMSVRLRVVRKDPDGRSLVTGCPLMTLAYERHLGGIVDLWGEGNEGRPCLVGKGKDPAVWFCSEAMAPLILHGPDLPPWILCTGGEGASKTTSLAQWVFCRVLKHLGHDRQIGVVAPTAPRMGRVLEAIAKHWRRSWMVGRRLKPTDREGTLTFLAGPSVMFVSAHQQSESEGSRIQGYNWVDAAPDEIQDCFDEWPNILARLRSAPIGLPAQVFASCTAKDNTAWRNFKGECAKGAWHIVRVPGVDSPFVPDLHWELMRNGGVTLREWQRRALAMDVGPEAAVYHCWSRKDDATGELHNLRPVPLGAEDITAEVMSPYGRNIGVLIGHDPGKRQHVSLFLKAYRFAEDVRRNERRPRWFVVDEVTSTSSTVNSHAQQVLKRAREKWKCNLLTYENKPAPSSAQLLVRIDPHTRGGTEHPGRDVYTVWRSLGMRALAAAYKPGSDEPMVIKIESRLDMMNTLLCATTSDADDGLRRLFIACDDAGNAAAPKLLAALESMERDAGGEAENERKDANDLSHWPCAVGYALWQIEHPRIGRAAA